MALSDLILNTGEVVVVLSTSELGIAPDGVALNFGSVQLVNQLSDKTIVGQSVWFDIGKATPFMIISGTTFYRLNESDISARETIIP